MYETEKLIEQIIEGIQDKKGKGIVVADLTEIDDTDIPRDTYRSYSRGTLEANGLRT